MIKRFIDHAFMKYLEAAAERNADDIVTSTRNEGEGAHILVIDDEESLRNVLEELLTREGHHVSLAQNGKEALEKFMSAPCKIVICDIHLPDMDGIEILHRIKQAMPETLVIIITSYASLETSIVALRAGAYDYLTKPFEDLDVVTRVVNRALEKIALEAENRRLMDKLRIENEVLAQANQILQDLAIKDGLTGLYNHRHFYEVLTREIGRAQRHHHQFSLLFMDVDHFKNYNDTHGHTQGDKLLRELAGLLQSYQRKSDMAARYGGEEFIMFLAETRKEDAYKVAQKILKTIAEHPFPGCEQQPLKKVTMSIGIATFPEDGTTLDELIRHADQLLYKAKDSGRNQVCLK